MALPNPALTQIPDSYKYGWHDSEMKPLHVMKKGLNADVVAEISHIKHEPEWMTKLRLKAYRHFEARPMPTWDEVRPLRDGRVVAYLVEGRVKQLAIVGSAVSVDDARALVLHRPSLEDVERLGRVDA